MYSNQSGEKRKPDYPNEQLLEEANDRKEEITELYDLIEKCKFDVDDCKHCDQVYYEIEVLENAYKRFCNDNGINE